MNPDSTVVGSFADHPLRLIWGLVADVGIFSATVFWSIVCMAGTLTIREGWVLDVCSRHWSRWVLWLCGIEVDVVGLEHLDRDKPYVLISNHLSYFDIWTTIAALPLKIRFVAKKELLKVPFFGQALALSDHIVIDRSNPEEAVARINQRVGAQVSEGFCILFYAEGTRSADGKVLPFKRGGVTLALRTGLPIVPMSVSGTRKFLPKRTWIIRPGGRVRIVLDRPIHTTRYRLEQRDALTELVRSIVIQNYVEDY